LNRPTALHSPLPFCCPQLPEPGHRRGPRSGEADLEGVASHGIDGIQGARLVSAGCREESLSGRQRIGEGLFVNPEAFRHAGVCTAVKTEQSTPFGLEAYVRLAWKHRWLIALILLVTMSGAALFTFSQTPIFEASTTMLIEPESPKVVNFQDVKAGSASNQELPEYYETQYALILSRPIVTRVIETLELRRRLPPLGTASDSYEALVGRFKVEAVRKTRLARIKAEDPDPNLAAEMANALAAEYMRHNVETKQRAAQEATRWLDEQMGGLRQKAQQSSSALVRYRNESNLLGIKEQREVTAQKVLDSNRSYVEAQRARQGIETKLRELTRMLQERSGAEVSLTDANNNSLLGRLRNQLSDLEVERSKLLQLYKGKHPDVIQIDAQIGEVKQRLYAEAQQMVQALETESRLAKAKEDSALASVNDLRREAQALSEKEARATTLQRETDASEQVTESVLKRVKETGIATRLDANNVQIVETAIPPRYPSKPRKLLIFAASMVVGLTLGGSVAVTTEMFDRSVRSPEDVERMLGLTVLGVVPPFGKAS
jgi:polysaccharide biosynthesis transport protein